MSPHSETLWNIEPHTKAKHEILRRYLGAWFAILGSRIPRIVYIDGFCGPGQYLGGEDGSPIIALNEALRQPILAHSEVTFLFIDDREDRIEHLKGAISTMQIPGNLHVEPIVNKFENTLEGLLDDLAGKGQQLAPTFAFIDPFGFKGAPFEVVSRLLANPRTEVFINIMIESINRFVEHPDDSIRKHIHELLGASDREVDEVIASPDRIAAFRQLYLAKLRQHAHFVRYFEMEDSRNKVLYYLFFATNHRLGHARIKEVFWKVDNQSGFKFSDRTNSEQLVLLELDPSIELAGQLKNYYGGRSEASEQVIEHVEDDTAYTCSHAKRALAFLERNRDIEVAQEKSDGTRRKKGTFPKGVLIRF